MSSLLLRFITLMKKGYSLNQISRELNISVSRARLIAATLAANGLVKTIDPYSFNCDSCSTCPLRKVCGFTPIRPSEQS